MEGVVGIDHVFPNCSVASWVVREAKVAVGPDWATLRGCMYGSHCSTP